MAYEITGNPSLIQERHALWPGKPSKFKDLFKSVLCGPLADLWPFYGFLVIAPVCFLFLSYSSETANHKNLTKITQPFLVFKSGHIQRLQRQSFFIPYKSFQTLRNNFELGLPVMFWDELDLRKSCKEGKVVFRKPPGKQDRCTETNTRQQFRSVHCCLKWSTWGHN